MKMLCAPVQRTSKSDGAPSSWKMMSFHVLFGKLARIFFLIFLYLFIPLVLLHVQFAITFANVNGVMIFFLLKVFSFSFRV